MRSRLSFVYLSIVGVLLSLQIKAQPTSSPDLQNLIRESPFVFQGTLRKLGASNMAAVPPSLANAVVTVDRVIVAPAQFGDFTGREITVALLRPVFPKLGESAVFFTSGWIYGQSIAVREVSHANVPKNLDLFREQIADAQRRNEEQDLTELLAHSEIVVAGRIVRIERVSREESRLPVTEHDPDLQRAYLQQERVLKGRIPSDAVLSFLFANSRDILWSRSPKLKEGQEAVWLLRRNEKKGLELESLTAFDPRDVQPPERRDVIDRLLKNQRQATRGRHQ
jgi:hypothetical protein